MATSNHTKNIIQERFYFYQRCQQSAETLNEFVEDVIRLSAACDFKENSETLIRDRVVFGLHNDEAKARIIQRGGNPSLEETVRLCDELISNKGVTNYLEVKLEIDDSGQEDFINIWESEPPKLEGNHDDNMDAFPGDELDNLSLLEPCVSISTDKSLNRRRCIRCCRHYFDLKKHKLTCNEQIRLPCQYCDVVLTKIALRRHVIKKHPDISYVSSDRKYECFVCKKWMGTWPKLIKHVQNSKTECRGPKRKKLRCDDCVLGFPSREKLRRHLDRHRQCSHCLKFFPNEGALNIHMENHARNDAQSGSNSVTIKSEAPLRKKTIDGIERERCWRCLHYFLDLKKHQLSCDKHIRKQCPHCDSVMTKRNLKRHMEYKHPEVIAANQEYECFICKKRLPSWSAMANHVRKTNHVQHQAANECLDCNKVFVRAYQLQRHMERHRQCSQCFKFFLNERLLDIHMVSHAQDIVYECYICHGQKKTFKTLQGHLSSVHSLQPKKIRKQKKKDFLCSQCGMGFKYKCLLNTHLMREDHQIAGGMVKPFECEVCHKRFSQKNQLGHHRRVHTGERPYTCEFCGKSFRSPMCVGEHRDMVHLKKKRYKCSVCAYQCYKSNGMRKHMLVHMGHDK